jgi:hypothetical protein
MQELEHTFNKTVRVERMTESKLTCSSFPSMGVINHISYIRRESIAMGYMLQIFKQFIIKPG